MMRTRVIEQPALLTPRLERYQPDGSLAEETPLESFPFILGRSDTADLQLDSARVSREHLEIVREGGTYRICDLGSTNGTFLNGRPVIEAELSDGDVLLVADLEISFFTGKREPSRGIATQVIDAHFDQSGMELSRRQLVNEVRRIHQVVSRRCVVTRFRPLVDLENEHVFGFDAVNLLEASTVPGAPCRLASTDCRLTARLRHLQRLVAVEEAARLPLSTALFVRVQTCEIGDEGLIGSLEQLAFVAGDDHRLVVEIPDAAVGDTPHFAAMHARLRELGIPLAYAGFASGPALIAQRAAVAPAFLKLNPSLTRAVRQDRRRNGQIEAIVRAAGQLGIEVIATGLSDQADMDACGRLGCRWGSGRQFGSTMPVDDWCRQENSQTPSAAVH